MTLRGGEGPGTLGQGAAGRYGKGVRRAFLVASLCIAGLSGVLLGACGNKPNGTVDAETIPPYVFTVTENGTVRVITTGP
jgi:hypothetical protein